MCARQSEVSKSKSGCRKLFYAHALKYPCSTRTNLIPDFSRSIDASCKIFLIDTMRVASLRSLRVFLRRANDCCNTRRLFRRANASGYFDSRVLGIGRIQVRLNRLRKIEMKLDMIPNLKIAVPTISISAPNIASNVLSHISNNGCIVQRWNERVKGWSTVILIQTFKHRCALPVDRTLLLNACKNSAYDPGNASEGTFFTFRKGRKLSGEHRALML